MVTRPKFYHDIYTLSQIELLETHTYPNNGTYSYTVSLYMGASSQGERSMCLWPLTAQGQGEGEGGGYVLAIEPYLLNTFPETAIQ